MTVELVDGDEVARQPVGRGREDPNLNPKLEAPARPDTSFFWLTSPLKVLRHIVWRRYKCCCVSCCLVLLAVGLGLSFLVSFPSNLWKKLLNVGGGSL